MSNTRVPTTVARIGGWADEFFAVVTVPIKVRFVEWAELPWRCESCGNHKTATCDHELAAEKAARKEWPK
jgi:hypothetical protein